jgi:hypothetical protein
MAYVSKTWVDRDAQYPTRRIIVHPDLTEEQVTVRRDEGIVTTQGDVFDANTMNNLEARIAAGIGEKQDTLTAGSGISIDENNVISATGGGGGSSTLSGLDDTNISSPQNGQALIYDAASSKWVNANGGSGSATLSGLTDVTLTTPTADQVLKYDGTKWVNGEGGGDVGLSKTVSGSICSFSDGADSLPMKSVVCEINAVQSGTGDPSPSNVRPISGWSSVGVTRAEKNLVGGSKLLANAQTFIPSGTTDTENKTFSFNSNAANDGKTFFTGDLSGKFKANTAYTFIFSISNTSTNPRSNMRVVYTDGTRNAIPSPSAQNTKETIVFTSNASKTVDYIDNSNSAGITTLYYDESGVFEGTLTASQFEPYNGTTVAIALGQTVYGGELDVTSGVLTVTHGYKLFSDLSWVTHSEYANTYYANVPNIKAVAQPSLIVNAVVSAYKVVSRSAQTNNPNANNFSLSATNTQNGRVFVLDDSYETKQAFENGTANYQLVYELAQPVSVQLTPTEIKTLLGTNNIWADTGDTTVTYYTSSASDVVDLVQYDTTKQDKLTEGTGITIDANNVISATGGGGAVIDDTTTSTTSVWSSSKTNSEIEATAAQILVPEFSTTKSYRSDDLCLHGGKFYMAITDIPAGAWDATKWAEQTLHDVLEFYSEAAVAWTDIDDLGNVQVDNLANGQVLKYNSTTQRWENANESGGGASALNDLSDVSVPSPTAGQVLTYQIAASVGQWIASPVPTPWFELTETVPAAQDPTNPDTVSIAFRDSRITANSTVDVYTSVQGKNYVSLGIVTGRISISYVTGQSSFEVKVRVS